MSERELHMFENEFEKELEANPEMAVELEREHAEAEKKRLTVNHGSELGDVVGGVQEFIQAYSVLPQGASLPLAVWVVATHLYEHFPVFPYLTISSPVKRCGKSRLGEVLHCLALDPVLTTGISEAALFRLVDQGGKTLILDEAESLKDKKNERSQAIVSILNSGYRDGASVYRCVGPKHELQQFSTYSPKVVIAIGSVPDTVRDRSIVIAMRRKRATENVQRFSLKRAESLANPLRDRISEVCGARSVEIMAAYENLPAIAELSDRDEEIWQPLFAICAVLVPARIGELKKAALKLCGGKAQLDADDSLPLRLLADIAVILHECDDSHGNIPSADLVSKLKELPEAPWNDQHYELTQARLAKMLRPFEVSSRSVKVAGKVLRGYLKIELIEAVSLYIPPGSATHATDQ